MAGEELQRVVFELNKDHWDAPSGNVIEYLHLVRYADATAVKVALLDGSLDAVVGSGVLAPADVAEFKTRHTSKFRTSLTEQLQNRIIIFNTAKAPTNDLKTRKILIHGVNKQAIVEKELGVLASPTDSLFPQVGSPPY